MRDQLPDSGSRRLRVSPPGSSPLATTLPEKPNPSPDETSTRPGIARRARSAAYSAIASRAVNPSAPRCSIRPSIRGRSRPPVAKLPLSRGSPPPAEPYWKRDNVSSRCPLPPVRLACGTAMARTVPVFLASTRPSNELPADSRSSAPRTLRSTAPSRVSSIPSAASAIVSSSAGPGRKPRPSNSLSTRTQSKPSPARAVPSSANAPSRACGCASSVPSIS